MAGLDSMIISCAGIKWRLERDTCPRGAFFLYWN